MDTIHALDRGDAQLISAGGVPAPLLRWRGVASVLAALAVGLMAGCASTSYPAAPESVASNDYSYVIGAGDNLNIMVWRNPELSMAVPVRPDGKIAAPLVDEMMVQGNTSVQVALDV